MKDKILQIMKERTRAFRKSEEEKTRVEDKYYKDQFVRIEEALIRIAIALENR